MKKIWTLALTLLLCGCLCLPAFAESFTGREGMEVTLTTEKTLTSNFGDTDRNPILEPGDDITFTVRVNNASDVRAEWYMKNEILHSLEDRSAAASGGAYSYRLAYVSDGGAESVLFDSDTVGGMGESPAGVGLHQADNALKDYFYFATLSPGEGGTVTLYVALEGESQGNAYQDTLADLQLAFATAILEDAPTPTETAEPTEPTETAEPTEPTETAEPTEPTETTGPIDPTEPTVPSETAEPTTTEPIRPTGPDGSPATIVKTGDNTQLFPFFLAMAISGLGLLVLLLINLLRKRKQRERGRFE